MHGPLLQTSGFRDSTDRPQSAGVIGRIRRALREVDQYSARREQTAWSRASDFWLLASFPAAVCLTALLAWSVQRERTVVLALGVISNTLDGRLTATFAPLGQPIGIAGTFAAGVEVNQRHETAGWPLIVWEDEHRPIVLVSDGASTRELKLEGFDETVLAIRVGLWSKMPKVAQRCADPSVQRVHYASLSGTIAVSWIVLIAGGLLAIQLVRFGAGVVTATASTRRENRRARGLCPHCGYLTKGLEFAPACPECGALLR